MCLQWTFNGGAEIQVKLNAGGLRSTATLEVVSSERLKFTVHVYVSPSLSGLTGSTDEYVSVKYPAASRLTLTADGHDTYSPIFTTL